MRKILSQFVLLMTVLVFNISTFYGQTKTVTLQKGEVFDILLLSQYPDVDAEFKNYFKSAVPVAQKMSYQPIPGFKISGLSQGNHKPSTLILGKWNSLKERESFINQITDSIPDFHEQRRKIWSYFGLKYYEVQKEITLNIDREKYHVATAYWLETGNKSSKYYEKWKKQIKKMGGEVLIQLKEGKTPFGYQYDPDFFIITTWESEADFKAFQKAIQKLQLDNIQHINEFILG